MQEKDILDNLFFTEKDEAITGASMRDPLGLQPIWSYYGRRVIKHLTTVSTDIRGFREVLLCLSICHSIKDHFKNETFGSLILYFEQLFVYSTIEHGCSDGILGAENGIGKFRSAGNNPKLSSSDTILVREISLGYYGRYKTPLNTMGIIDRNSLVANDIDVAALYGRKSYNAILDAFEAFMRLRESDRYYKNFKSSKKLMEVVCGNFRNGEADFWLNELQISGERKDYLMGACYGCVDASDDYKDTFDRLQSNDKVSDIEKLEPFLRCMESVFYVALGSRRIQDVSLEDDILAEHVKRFAEFKRITCPDMGDSYLLSSRMSYMKKNCIPGTDDYVINILNYHKMVCVQKHRSTWLEVDSAGNIQAFVQPEFMVNNAYTYLNEWGRNYYASSLHSIKLGIGALSQ